MATPRIWLLGLGLGAALTLWSCSDGVRPETPSELGPPGAAALDFVDDWVWTAKGGTHHGRAVAFWSREISGADGVATLREWLALLEQSPANSPRPDSTYREAALPGPSLLRAATSRIGDHVITDFILDSPPADPVWAAQCVAGSDLTQSWVVSGEVTGGKTLWLLQAREGGTVLTWAFSRADSVLTFPGSSEGAMWESAPGGDSRGSHYTGAAGGGWACWAGDLSDADCP